MQKSYDKVASLQQVEVVWLTILSSYIFCKVNWWVILVGDLILELRYFELADSAKEKLGDNPRNHING